MNQKHTATNTIGQALRRALGNSKEDQSNLVHRTILHIRGHQSNA